MDKDPRQGADPKQGGDPARVKQARLAEALRANLVRRKQQGRARSAAATNATGRNDAPACDTASASGDRQA